MRAFDNGCYFTVLCSERDVSTFNAKWPCSELSDRSLWFRFDKRNGDLVDTNVSESEDGSAAVALSSDAMIYGARRLRLPLTDWHPAFKA